MRTRRQVLGSALAAGMVAWLTHNNAAAQDDTDVEAILAKASERLAEVESLHFTLEIEGETFIDDTGTIQLESAEGDLERPDKVSVEFQVSLFGAGTVSIRMITIGEESWTTDLITGNWGDAPPEFGYDPSVLYDNQNGLGPVMGKLETAEIDGVEEIDDRECHHIVGTVSNEVITPLTAGTMSGDDIAIELWIDTETSDLLKVRVVEPENPEKENPATWELTLSRFNDKVTIEPPV
jgi:lipoprotein LprG